MSFDRRRFLLTGAAGLAAASASSLRTLAGDVDLGPAALPSGTLEASVLEALPGKVPLIKKSWRPPNFETPVSYFNEAFTPNDAFFVRYHLATIPEVAPQDWRLRVGGDGLDKPFELTLAQLRSEFEPGEINAVCQCSGNRRGLSSPHVAGRAVGLWRHGQRALEGSAAQGRAGPCGTSARKR